jgi:hypothetical protein
VFQNARTDRRVLQRALDVTDRHLGAGERDAHRSSLAPGLGTRSRRAISTDVVISCDVL